MAENDLDILDKEGKLLQLCEPNVPEYCNHEVINKDNTSKLKDLAGDYKIVQAQEVSNTHEAQISKEAVKFVESSESHLVNSHINLDNNNTSQPNMQMDKLLLIVQEYEDLKEKYLELETNVNSKLYTNTDPDPVNISVKEINTLQLENQRLTDEIELLNKQNIENVKLQAALQSTITRLELDTTIQKGEIADAIDRLSAHDAAAKRAITVLQKEMGTKVEQVTKMYQESVSEKDAYIIKFAKLEATLHELKQSNSTHHKKSIEQDTEIDQLKNILKIKENEYIKTISLNERLQNDILKLTKRLETHKEEMDGQEIKNKWSQNKLKAELEAHKETKKQVNLVTNKLQESKEEGEQIRKDCQEMIERYQGDEEINSVSLRKQLQEQLKKQEEKDNLYTQQGKDFQEQTKELKLITEDNGKLSQELNDQKAVVIAAEGKNTNLAHQLLEKQKDCAEMKTLIDSLKEELKRLQDVEVKTKGYEVDICNLRKQVGELTQQLNDSVIAVSEHKEKESEILLYSQSLTESNALSKASITDLQTKLCNVSSEKDELCLKFRTLEQDFLSKIDHLTNDKRTLQEEVKGLVLKVEQKSIIVNEISGELEEARNELKVMKKKNTSQLKDLQRELHSTTRRLEQLDSNSNGSCPAESFSNRSRTSSCNSLEKIHAADSPTYSDSPNRSSSPQPQPTSVKCATVGVVIPQDHYVTQPYRGVTTRNNNGVPELEIDKKVLVERICKLQKIHAKKNEKIEFLEDHNLQLTEALQKKTRIIQHYFLKQEGGSFTSDKFDDNKAAISQHGGIMSSVYSAKPMDKGMTLELSVTINHKLQAVLEDTVLKNITLQESINTLGIEIAKLQEESKSKT